MPPIEHEIRELGVWWLPESRDKQVSGILTFTPADGASLELIGMLRGLVDVAAGAGPHGIGSDNFDEAGNYGRICGVAGGKSFTLEGCFRTGASNLFASGPGRSTERVHVNRFIRGAEFEPGEQVETTRVEVRLLHLPYWIARGGVAMKHYLPDTVPEGEPLVSLEANLLPDRRIELDSGMTLSLCEEIVMVGDRVTEAGLNRDVRVRLEGKQQDLQDYLRILTIFQDLVSIGTGRTSTFEAFSFHHPEVVHELRDGTDYPVTIEFFAQWVNWETRMPGSVGLHDVLFNLTDLGGEPAVQRWIRFALDHQGTIARVMGTRYRTGGYVSDRLLNRAAALEALDRDTHGQDDESFKNRMLRLATIAGSPFGDAVGDVDRWASRFKKARIAAAHHSNRHPAEAGHLDYYLSEVAYYLFVLCLLRHIGADDRAVERVLQDDGFLHAAGPLKAST